MGWGTAVIFLVEERPNPSSDCFVMPALRAIGAEVRRCGFSEVVSPLRLDQNSGAGALASGALQWGSRGR